MILIFVLLIWFFSYVENLEDPKEISGLIFKANIPRVDRDVKRPVRFCQGFEDPEEIDCYMRSDIKTYVCTEPVSFNPCESLERVETYHYDHIIHRCVKVNVPACEGQIIRVLTLLQCLIYCHNKDPFALGKSKSLVFNLNQNEPLLTGENDENEIEKDYNNQQKEEDSNWKSENVTSENPIEKKTQLVIENNSDIKELSGSIAGNNKEKIVEENEQTNNAISDQAVKKQGSIVADKLKNMDATLFTENSMNLSDNIEDDGFYLWDE